MTDEDRAALADLAMRVLDTIIEDYGEGSELCAASLVFEVKVSHGPDPGDDVFHANYKSLAHNSPHHIGGLLHSTALHILSPESDIGE
jgi:hypothetical protein